MRWERFDLSSFFFIDTTAWLTHQGPVGSPAASEDDRPGEMVFTGDVYTGQ